MTPCDAAAAALSWSAIIQSGLLALTGVSGTVAAVTSAIGARHARANGRALGVVQAQTNGVLSSLAAQHADAVNAARQAAETLARAMSAPVVQGGVQGGAQGGAQGPIPDPGPVPYPLFTPDGKRMV